MGNLLMAFPPFEHCGIDYCRTFLYKREAQWRSPTDKVLLYYLFVLYERCPFRIRFRFFNMFWEDLEQMMIAKRVTMYDFYDDNATNFV